MNLIIGLIYMCYDLPNKTGKGIFLSEHPRYNWNIVESGVKHHALTLSFRFKCFANHNVMVLVTNVA